MPCAEIESSPHRISWCIQKQMATTIHEIYCSLHVRTVDSFIHSFTDLSIQSIYLGNAKGCFWMTNRPLGTSI